MVTISDRELKEKGNALYEKMKEWLDQIKPDGGLNSLVITYACFRMIYLMYQMAIDMNPVQDFDKEFADITNNAKRIVRTLRVYKECKDKEWASQK